MLTHLQVSNFAIIDKLELDFQQGLTVVTGETGAGKSIIIDALAVVLGERTDNTIIRHGQDKCEITACFDLSKIPIAQQWLIAHDYDQDNECIIRRTIDKDGRSKAAVNGTPCSLQQIREFASLFINIHSQNQQQSLTKKNYQRELLDLFANHSDLSREVFNLYHKWLETYKQYENLKTDTQSLQAQLELLHYQIEELDKVGLTDGEYQSLDQDHKQLANAEKLMQHCQQALTLLQELEPLNVLSLLYQTLNHLRIIQESHPKIQQTSELINNATIQVEEVISEIRNFSNVIEINPDRLYQIEKRIEKIHELARKHHVQPQDLFKLHQELTMKLTHLNSTESHAALLLQSIDELQKKYHHSAKKLSKSRRNAALKLNTAITEKIQNLGMPGGAFEITFYDIPNQEPQPHGNELIEFLVAANKGHPLQPLHKVASGGELSRIALAIYVTTAQIHLTPTLIFDEVDVGIGGSTAAIVGQLLRSLSQNVQILCITHLPQVAAHGHHHLRVDKHISNDQTLAKLEALDENQKVYEIARMLGGVKITDKTLDHAKEMLALEAIS